MREESDNANGEGEPSVLDEVQHVEIDREVVFDVSAGDVVEVCLLDEFTAIAV